MKIFIKKTLGFLLLMVGGLALLFVALNLSDDQIQPEYKTILDQTFPVPENAVNGYKYFVGLQVPVGVSPLERGTEIYQQIVEQLTAKRSDLPEKLVIQPSDRSLQFASTHNPLIEKASYFTKKDYQDNRKAIADYLAANAEQLKRYDELLKFKAYGLDQKPVFGMLITSVTNYFRLSRLKLLQINSNLHNGQGAKAIKELAAMNDFIQQSMQYPETLLGTMINTAILKDIRTYVGKSVEEYPHLKTSVDVEKFRMKQSYQELMQKTMYVEGNAIASLFLGPIKIEDFLELGNPKNYFDKITYYTLKNMNWLMPLLYKPNKTINQTMHTLTTKPFLPCISNATKCPDETRHIDSITIVNPVGNMLSIIVDAQSQRYKKLYMDMQLLNTPIAL